MKLAQKQTFISLAILATLIVAFSVIAIVKAGTAPKKVSGYYKPDVSVSTNQGLTVTTDTVVEGSDEDSGSKYHKKSHRDKRSGRQKRNEAAKPKPTRPSSSPLDQRL